MMERLIIENHSAPTHHQDLLRGLSDAPTEERHREPVHRLYQRLVLRVASLLIACGEKLEARYHESLQTPAARLNS